MTCCAGCKGHSSDTRHLVRGSPHHDPGYPLRLQLRVQAARDGKGDQQDQGGDE